MRKTLKITVGNVDGVDGIPLTKISFQNNLKQKISGMTVIRSFGASSVTEAPFIEFSEVSGVINITKVVGLVANVEYQLVIQIIGN